MRGSLIGMPRAMLSHDKVCGSSPVASGGRNNTRGCETPDRLTHNGHRQANSAYRSSIPGFNRKSRQLWMPRQLTRGTSLRPQLVTFAMPAQSPRRNVDALPTLTTMPEFVRRTSEPQPGWLSLHCRMQKGVDRKGVPDEDTYLSDCSCSVRLCCVSFRLCSSAKADLSRRIRTGTFADCRRHQRC